MSNRQSSRLELRQLEREMLEKASRAKADAYANANANANDKEQTLQEEGASEASDALAARLPAAGSQDAEELNEGKILLRQVDTGKVARGLKRRATSSLLSGSQSDLTGDYQQQQQQEQPAQNTFNVPTVFIATCGDETGTKPKHKQTNDSKRQHKHHSQEHKQQQQQQHKQQDQVKQEVQRSSSSESSEEIGSNGAPSTTSEVNSYDDATSIASRLSQIVDEQEFILNHYRQQQQQQNQQQNQQQHQQRQQQQQSSLSSSSSSGFATTNSMGNLLKALESAPPSSKRTLKQQHSEEAPRPALGSRSASSLAVSSLERSPSSRLATQEANVKAAPADHQAVDSDKLGQAQPERLRAKSFTTQALNRETAALRFHRNESSGSLGGGGTSNQFLPERGTLKSLESSRQQQQQASSTLNRFKENNTGLAKGAGGELMLNIRRSAWKLDEFEQAFKPASSDPSEAAAHQADSDEPAANNQRFPSLERSISSGSTKNLFIRASRRNAALRQQRNNEHLQTVNLSPSSQSPLSLKGPTLSGLGAKRRFSHSDLVNGSPQHQPTGHKGELLPSIEPQHNRTTTTTTTTTTNITPTDQQQRRPSRISISSFASSFDSFQTRRPFGRLGSLLSPSPRKRHQQQQQQDQARAADGGGGCCCSMSSLKQYLPVLEWLPAYNLRRDLWGDLTAGLAVAVLNISTSLSAAVVAETDLSVAFRSSIVNTFVYAVLCSSRHTSFGSWSIMSQMLLDSVRRALSDELILSRINLGPSASWSADEYETWHMNIIIMYTFLIGLVQLLAGLLNLGNILASFIPEALCSSMIAATAFTMAVGQLANMCGTSNKILWAIEKNTTELAWADLKTGPVSITDLFAGLFRWVQQMGLLAKHNDQINVCAVLMSCASVILLTLNQCFLQDKLRALFKKSNLFIPFEMILLIMWTVVSRTFELRDLYKVPTCGPMFIEFNLPNVPNLRLFRELWFDSLATALISYTMVFIMAKTYSNKLNYEINANQELIACGAGNLIGGLFDALPATASFSRTAGQVEAGGRTQMASLVNCCALVILARFLGEHVAHLPVCVMSATLFFGFVRMMARFQEVTIYWRICKVDFAIWLFTFVAILALDLVNGFVYGFIFSILTMLYRAQNRRCYLLGSIGSTADVYVPLAKYPLACELDSIKIFQFCGPIHYVCSDLFERHLRQKTGVNVKQILHQFEEEQTQLQAQTPAATFEHTLENGTKLPRAPINPRHMNLPTHIILDFSMISFIDSAGIYVIKKIIVDYQRVNITVMLASLASHVAQVVKNEPSLWETHKDRFYVTLADAVHHAMRDSNNNMDYNTGAISISKGQRQWPLPTMYKIND